MQVQLLKPKLMSAIEIKEILHRRIEEVDESFLEVVYAMMETYVKQQEEAVLESEIMNAPVPETFKPLSEDELMARLAESSAQVDRGEYVTIEELKAEVEQW